MRGEIAIGEKLSYFSPMAVFFSSPQQRCWYSTAVVYNWDPPLACIKFGAIDAIQVEGQALADTGRICYIFYNLHKRGNEGSKAIKAPSFFGDRPSLFIK